mgnify:CR=1 FL=1
MQCRRCIRPGPSVGLNLAPVIIEELITEEIRREPIVNVHRAAARAQAKQPPGAVRSEAWQEYSKHAF